ncbi:MAG: proton-conducting transporter transmembrane domain-containing protein [Ferrimicrobium sp.]
MTLEFVGAAFVLLVIAVGADVVGVSRVARWSLGAGVLLALVGTLVALPEGSGTVRLYSLGATTLSFRIDAAACWLLLPGWLTAFLASISQGGARRGWMAGVGLALIGALGVSGMQDGVALLVSWELMSFGGAVMLLSAKRDADSGQASLFMLSLLEVGAVALLLALVVIGPNRSFGSLPLYLAHWGGAGGLGIGVLFLVGFGAKLGVLPFYEWYPDAYSSGSGASGVVLSGVVLNAAYFALGRALLRWLPVQGWGTILGVIVLGVGIFSAVLAVFYAFQQNDWRRLLAFSSAENASIAVTALGAAILFRADHQAALASLAWIVGIIHLMGHSLAKASLFFCADVGAESSTNGRAYRIAGSGLWKAAPFTVGVGAVLGAMSLAAMPPTAGFVSEWLLFQTIFHDFVLSTDGSRLALILAGAGLALTAAVSLATFVKLIGVGLLGSSEPRGERPALRGRVSVLLSGVGVVALAASVVFWLPSMGQAAWPDRTGVALIAKDLLIVPLSSGFAFISPLMLMGIGPVLALVPVVLLALALRRRPSRRAPVWSGGEGYSLEGAQTTSLAFSNALRVFYSFVYRPRNDSVRDFADDRYVLRTLHFDSSEAPIFGPLVFRPAKRVVLWLADRLRVLQGGQQLIYLALIGILLLGIFASVFL